MPNIKYLLIVACSLLAFLAPAARAQMTGVPDDCQNTLYKNDFRCTREKISSYCGLLSGGANVQTAETAGGGAVKFNFNLYQNAYCDAARDREDEIFKILAKQLEQEDLKYSDPDFVKYVLRDLNTKSIGDYLQAKYGDRNKIDQLPAEVQSAFFTQGNFGEQDRIYRRIKSAYENQRMIYYSQESLKQQFKGREMWVNGSLSDSPFDLIVDLNLIDIALFGSQAGWVSPNDVWKWPKNPEEAAITGAGGPAGAPGIPSAETGKGETEPKDQKQSGAAPDEYECVPSASSGVPGASSSGAAGAPASVSSASASGQPEKENLLAPNLTCQDRSAITFKSHTPKVKGGSAAPGGTPEGTPAPEDKKPETPPLSCPPGATPVKKPSAGGQPAGEPTVPQSPNYPGPYVGGVLKNFPPVKKPDCPAGSVPAEITLAGQSIKECMPTQLCADPNNARDFLYGLAKGILPKEDLTELPATRLELPENHLARKMLDAVEVSVCVKITTGKRAESTYPVSEGCIDCHLLAMNDILAKMLQKPVTPRQNTMQSWASTNRWGPNFAFNLNVVTATLKNVFFMPKPSGAQTKKDADAAVLKTQQEAKQKVDPLQTAINAIVMTRPPADIMNQALDDQKQANEKYYASLKNFRSASELQADQNTFSDLQGYFKAFKDSFERLRDLTTLIGASNNYKEKKPCTF